ncbi:MAG: MFS transporter [Oscillospiraceae bacterium]|nr:MFS transporter [Oscillospiraceae bacterium]
MNKKINEKIKGWVWIGAVVMVALTMLITGLLGMMSQRKAAAGILVETQKFVAVSAVEQIEFAVSVGKPLEKFYGAGDILKRVSENSNEIIAVWLSDENKNVLYKFPDDFVPGDYTADDGDTYVNVAGNYYCEIPVRDTGAICMLIDGTVADEWVDEYTKKVTQLILVVSAAAFIFFLLLKLLMKRRFDIGKKTVIAVIAFAQVFMVITTFNFFKNSYYEKLDSAAEIIANVIKSDVEKLTVAGIPPEEFVNFDEYLQGISDYVPAFSYIQFNFHTGGKPETAHIDLSSEYMELYGIIDQRIISSALVSNVIDTVVLTAVVIFIMLELLFFIGTPGTHDKKRRYGNVPAARFFYFIFYAGFSMCAPFLAVVSYKYAMKFESGAGILVGIPVTIEMLAGVFGIALGGKILSRIGIVKTLYLCIAACGIGAVLSGFSSEIVLFTAARAIAGFAFSLATITGRIAAAAQPEEELRSQMLTALLGGTLIGFCCGAVIGGLLSDRFGFSFVFLLSAAMLLICLPFLKKMGLSETPSDKFSSSGFLSLLKTPGTAAFLLLIVFPLYAAGVFVSFGVPLYGAIIGLSSTIISALIMANSLIAAYLAPFTSRLVRKFMGCGKGVIFYGILTSLLLFVTALFPNLLFLVCSVVLLGVADSFGLVLVIEKFTADAKNAGAMIGMTLTGKAGQTAAPPVITAGGGTPLFLAFGAAVGTVVYALRFSKKHIPRNNSPQ